MFHLLPGTWNTFCQNQSKCILYQTCSLKNSRIDALGTQSSENILLRMWNFRYSTMNSRPWVSVRKYWEFISFVKLCGNSIVSILWNRFSAASSLIFRSDKRLFASISSFPNFIAFLISSIVSISKINSIYFKYSLEINLCLFKLFAFNLSANVLDF